MGRYFKARNREEEALAEGLKRYFSGVKEVVAVYLFGSATRGKESPGDIDLAILLDRTIPPDLLSDIKLRLMREVEDAAGREVDLVFLGEADPVLEHQVRKYGRLLFERDRGERIRYEILSRKRYFDFLIYHRRYMKELRRALRGG